MSKSCPQWREAQHKKPPGTKRCCLLSSRAPLQPAAGSQGFKPTLLGAASTPGALLASLPSPGTIKAFPVACASLPNGPLAAEPPCPSAA